MNRKTFCIRFFIAIFIIILPHVTYAQWMCRPVTTCVVTNVSQGGETKTCWDRMECDGYPSGVTYSPINNPFSGGAPTPSGGGSAASAAAQEQKKKECLDNANTAKSTCHNAYATLNRLCVMSSALAGRGVGWAGGRVVQAINGSIDAKLYEAMKSMAGFAGFESDILSSSCSNWHAKAQNYCEAGGAKLASACK